MIKAHCELLVLVTLEELHEAVELHQASGVIVNTSKNCLHCVTNIFSVVVLLISLLVSAII